jgi:flagellar basal-body rod protein FlgC
MISTNTFMSNLNIPGSALTAEQYRLNIIAQNVSNMETTRRADGLPGPYRRKIPIYREMNESPGFGVLLGRQLAGMRGERRTFEGYLKPVALNGRSKEPGGHGQVTVANNAVFVRPEVRGMALNSVTPRTGGDWIRNKFPIRGPEGPAEHQSGVRIERITEDPTPGRVVFDPSHPDADENGYVEFPNVEMLTEMVDMMGVSRAYEANVQVVGAIRSMAMSALNIGR